MHTNVQNNVEDSEMNILLRDVKSEIDFKIEKDNEKKSCKFCELPILCARKCLIRNSH